MAKFVLKNAVVVINGVDLSNRVSSVTIETEFDAQDATAMGGNYREIVQGMGDATMTFEVFQDFAAGNVDATLFPLSQSGATFLVQVKPTNGAISATNPEYQMTGVLLSYSPIDGAVGDLSTTSVEIQNASQTGLVRDVTP